VYYGIVLWACSIGFLASVPLVRLEAAWWPFVVMFLVVFLLRLVPWALLEIGAIVGPGRPLQIQRPVEWAALFGSLFTAFWWIAIRRRQSPH
jgi:hypothetical protein